MRTVHDILKDKGDQVYSVKPTDTVLHALGVMAEHGIGAVIVLDGDKLVGILTERDYARKVVLAGRSSKDSEIKDVMTSQVACEVMTSLISESFEIKDVMTSQVACVAPERSVDECMALMTQKRVRHLPVVDHKTVVGLVSIGDLVKATIADQQFTIEQLQSYIMGA